MNNWIFTLFLLFIIIFACFSWSFYEPFINANETNANETNDEEKSTSANKIVFLGDSILNNSNYVPQGKSVPSLVSEKVGSGFYNFAEDSSTINGTYSQINSIPIDLNEPTTYIFLSVGGNDILNRFVNTSATLDKQEIMPIYESYQHVVKSLKKRMNKANIVLLDIFYPKASNYQEFKPVLEDWNKLISEYSSNYKNEISDTIKTSLILSADGDLVENDYAKGIEPSEQGGAKLVERILQIGGY